MLEEEIDGILEEEAQDEDPQEELTSEEQDEKRKKRRYLVYGGSGFFLVMTILIIAFATSGSEDQEVVDAKDSNANVPHPIVEIAKIKNVPLQGYSTAASLIANTPQELMFNIDVEGWIPSALDYSKPGLTKKFSCLECPREKIVDLWLKIFPNNQDGRKELYTILQKNKEDNLSIVSEAAEMGSGGFIVNDGKTISYWFYYEPNIVARANMYHSKEGTLQETREWAHRLNYSIYKVIGR